MDLWMICEMSRQSRSQLKILWKRARKLMFSWGNTVKIYCWSWQVKANSFRWFLQIGVEKKALARSIAAYQTPGALMIFSTKSVISRAAVVIGVITSLLYNSSQSFFTTHLPSAWAKLINGNMIIKTIPTFFNYLMVALISGISPVMQYPFNLYLARTGKWLRLPFSLNGLTPQVKCEDSAGFKCIYSNYTFRNWGNKHK